MENMSRHAQVRAQQRAIPYELIQILKQYGAKAYDNKGGCIRYFDTAAKRRVLHRIGRSNGEKLISNNSSVYCVEKLDTGLIVTVGHRYRPIRRNRSSMRRW